MQDSLVDKMKVQTWTDLNVAVLCLFVKKHSGVRGTTLVQLMQDSLVDKVKVQT
jgi:hypothetical protein